MSGVTGLDIRMPIGGLFTVLGLILVGYGAATAGDAAHYERSLGININVWWGAAILAFGLMMVFLARRASPSRARTRGATSVDNPGA